MLAAGFGFVEAGTVTPLPQPGNPKPRVFRLSEDRAVINRLSFNGTGLAPYVGRISKREKGLGPFGANIGKNKATEDGAADYEICVEAVAPYVDYLVANVSSPNTPGLRAMQGREILKDMLVRVLDARARAGPDVAKRPPLIVKIAPDLDDDERAELRARVPSSQPSLLSSLNAPRRSRPSHALPMSAPPPPPTMKAVILNQTGPPSEVIARTPDAPTPKRAHRETSWPVSSRPPSTRSSTRTVRGLLPPRARPRPAGSPPRYRYRKSRSRSTTRGS